MEKSTDKRKKHGLRHRVLWLCLLLLAGTSGVFAQVARIGETTYTDLTEAFYDASAGQTVELLQDVDISVTTGSDQYCAEIPNSIIFDGKGHKLTVNRRGISVAPQSNNAKARRAPAASSTYDLNVTIKNVTIENTASQSRGYGGRCITTRGKLGSLTLDNVILTTDGSTYNNTLMPLYIGGSQATAATINLINGSQIIADASAAKGNAITTVNPIALNITSSTLKAANAINFAEADESAGSNGTTVNITGSTLTSSTATLHFYDNNISVTITGTTIDAGAGSVATFGSTSNNVVSLTGADNTATYTTLTDASDSENFSVSGGQFSQVVSDDLLAEGYICHKVATGGKYLVEQGTYAVKIGNVGYPNMTEAFKCASDNDLLVLQRDVDATSEPMYDTYRNLGINNSIIVDGGNHTLTVKKRGIATTGLTRKIDVTLKNITIANSDADGRCVDTRGYMNSLTLENAVLTTAASTSKNYDQPLTIGGNQLDAMQLVIKNSTIETSADGSAYYAIITFNPVNATVEGSTLKGWACIYAREASSSAGSAGSIWNIKDSKLYSTNKYNGASNSFSAIMINDDNVTVNIENSELHIDATLSDQYQAIASFSNNSNCGVKLGNGNTIDLQGESATYAFNLGTSEFEVQAGTTSNVAIPEEYCADGLIPVQNQDGTYGVKTGEFIVDGNDGLGYESLAAAIAAGNTTLSLRSTHASESIFTIEALTVASDVTVDLNNLTLQTTNGITLNNGTLTFTNGNVKGDVVANGGSLAFVDCGTNDISVSGNETLSLASGTFANDIDEKYLAAHYATNLINGAYVVKATVQIATVADLQALAALCNSGSTSAQTIGNTYELVADLDLSSVANWSPMGGLDSYQGTAFKGTFDGKNHTISNLTCNDTHANYATAALFGVTKDATIKNLTLSNVNVHSSHYAAALVAYTSDGSTTIKNCHVNGGSIISSPELVGSSYDNGDKVGAIIGYANNANIINCSVEDVTLQAYSDLGGLSGYMNAGTLDDNTLKDVTLTQSDENAYKWVDSNDHSQGTADMSETVGLVVGGRSNSDVIAQANNTEMNTITNVNITDPVVVARIGDTKFPSLSAAIAAATEGQTVEICKAGTYTLPNLPQNITVKGIVEGVVFNCKGSDNIASIPNGATFENVTMNFGGNDYHGFQHPGTINMNNCTLNGKLFSYGDMNFDGCTFNAPASDYSMWAYAGNLTYTDCTFNCPGGKCVNVYNDQAYTTPFVITAKNSTFNSEQAKKAAFNVKATCGSIPLRYEVVIEDCEATGSWPTASTSESLVVLNSLVQVDDINANVASVTDVVQITTDPVTGEKAEEVLYTTRVAEYDGTRYDTLAEALDAAESSGDKNIVVNLINNAELTIAAWSGTQNRYAIGTAETETITINGNNHALTFMTTDTDWNNVATMNDAQTKLILNDMTIDQGGKNTNGTWNAYDINFNCAVELNNVTSNRPLAFKNAATVNNVTINNDKDVYGIWIQTNGQDVNIDGLTLNVPNGRGIAIKDQYVNSEPAETTSLAIENATFTTAKKAAILATAKYGAEITASNLDISNVTADNVNAVWVDEDLANQYDNITFTSQDATMIPEGGVAAYTVVRHTGATINGYYTDLQKAINEAEDGQTITLAADFDLAATSLTVNTDADITIDGAGHSISSSAAQAVLLKGAGDVTFSNVNITASAGHGIQVGDDNDVYSGLLTINQNSVLTVAKRGVRVYAEDTGFGIAIANSTIQSNVADPTTSYTVGNDAMALSLGTTDNKGYDVTIDNSELRGFSYDINSVTSGSNLNVTMTGGKTYGRAALNVWGSNNTFTLDGVDVHGLNNQTGPTEAFACIVENTGASNNTYNINGVTFSATLSEAAMAAAGSTASEQMIDLRGTGATVKITGETTYTSNDSSGERSGLIFDEGALQSNTVSFDATAKESLSAIIIDLAVTSPTSEPDATGLYALTFQGVAHLYNAAMTESKYFSTLNAAFEDNLFEPNSQIDLLANVTINDDITISLAAGEEFAIDCYSYTLTAGTGHILLPTDVTGSTTKATDVFSHVELRDDVVPGTSALAPTYYTNSYVATHHEVAYTAAGETDVDYYYFEETFDDEGFSPEAGATITLQKDITLVQSVSAANSFNLNLNGHSMTRGDYTITLASGVTVTTDAQVADYDELFIPAAATNMVVEAQSGSYYTYSVVTKESEGFYELTDNDAGYTRAEAVQATSVSFTRTFTDETHVGKNQAWFLPFDYTVTEADLDNLSFYKISLVAASANAQSSEVVDENAVFIHIVELPAGTTLKANMPYLVRPKSAGTYTFTSENVKLEAAIPSDNSRLFMATSSNQFNFYGNYTTYNVTQEHELMQMRQGLISYYNAGGTVRPFRWFIKVTGNNSGYVKFHFVEDDEEGTVTTIETVDNGDAEIEGYYTVGGLRSETPVKGLNIIKYTNGKTQKVYVK